MTDLENKNYKYSMVEITFSGPMEVFGVRAVPALSNNLFGFSGLGTKENYIFVTHMHVDLDDNI